VGSGVDDSRPLHTDQWVKREVGAEDWRTEGGVVECSLCGCGSIGQRREW